MKLTYYFILCILLETSFSSVCQKDLDCSEMYVCESFSCQHKNLFPTVLPTEIGGLFVFFLFSIITTIAGISGGLVFLPILMLMFDFSTQEAVPISITMIFVLLVLRTILSLSDRHPFRDKPVINYDLALIFSPSIVIGTIFGVIINKVSATWLLMIFILILLSLNAIVTGKKAVELKKKSQMQNNKKDINLTHLTYDYINKFKKNTTDEDNLKTNENKNIIQIPSDAIITEENISKIIEINNDFTGRIQINDNTKDLKFNQIQEKVKILEKILKRENRLMDYEKLVYLFINIIIYVLFLLLGGNQNITSFTGIEYCSVGYWLFQFAYIPFGFLFLIFSYKTLLKEYNEKVEFGYIFHQNDKKWDINTCFVMSVNGFFAGLTSPIVGGGGAIITAPLLLNMGYETQEASFTASFMALFSSIVTIIQYIIIGKIKWDYAAFCGGISLIGMIIGLKGILKELKKRNMIYVIVVFLVFLIVTTSILNVYSNINELVNVENSRNFHYWC